MDASNWTDKLKDWLDQVLHSSELGTVVLAVIIILLTAVTAHLVTAFLRRILKSNKGPLPSVSIFVNIGRVTVWTIGISIMLSSCFNVNVGAAVTALGIGGIAISLGFQDTLSNLIGGLQIIMAGLIEPGDHVKVGNFEGTVRDVTWRHTTITNVRNEEVVIPNSVINTQALVKLPPDTDVRVEIYITEMDKPLKQLVTDMQNEIDKAVAKVAVVEDGSQISVMAKTERGYKALVSITTGMDAKKGVVIDAIMKAISDCAVKAPAPDAPEESHKKTFDEKIMDLDSGGAERSGA